MTTLAASAKRTRRPPSNSSKSTSKAPSGRAARRGFFALPPKVIVVEAIKPLTLAPAWDEWEPCLPATARFVWDDELNRYYVAAEARAIAPRLAEARSVCGRLADWQLQGRR